ncbi:MAG: ATP-binding protein [Calditerrivibrio sp.]|nr:ATP-binding protein [Calditerrivibrio sp.]
MERLLFSHLYIPTSKKNVLLVIIATLLVTYLHYSVSDSFHIIHIMHYYMYYLIVIYAAIKMGLLGGIVASFFISILYDYEIYLYLLDIPHYKLRSFVEVIMLFTVGGFTGYFSQKLFEENQKLQHTKNELLKTLNELQKNIDEKTKMEKELSRIDKLRLMGEISASIAHEVRNPLSAIKSAATLISNNNMSDDLINIIIKESEQLEKFVSKFTQFIRKSEIKKEKINIPEFLVELEDYVKMYIKDKNKKYSIKDRSKITEIYTDKIALKHILLNLIINAFEATQDINNGRVEIEFYNDNNHVYFSIWDNGVGIKKDHIDKIFEPFFTNKEEGTGLGLSISLKLATELGGTILLEHLDGTKFILRLPI